MAKGPGMGQTGGEGRAPIGKKARKERLAAALRRNLAKRKDTKEAKSGDNTERE